MLVFLLLWQTVEAIQLFDIVYGSTSGGPGQSTVVVVYYIYRSIRDVAYGTGAAAAFVVAGGLMLVTLRRVGRRPRADPPDREGDRMIAALRRRLPFDPWHLVLAPACALLAAPLVWMLLASFMNNQQLNRFPPTIIPGSLHTDGYQLPVRQRRAADVVPELGDRQPRLRRGQPGVLLDGRLRVRAAGLPRLARCCWRSCWGPC